MRNQGGETMTLPPRLTTPRLLMTFTFLYLLAEAQIQDEPENERLRELTDHFWQWKLLQYPEDATSEDFHDNDDKLESFTLETFRQRKDNCSEFLAEALLIDEHSLSPTDVLTLRVLKDQLQTYVDGWEWRDYGNLSPINFLEGIHKSMTWVQATNFRHESDYRKYLTRLHNLPHQIDELTNLMRRAILQGTVNHRVSVIKVPAQIDQYLNCSPQETPFFPPFTGLLDNLTISRHKRHEIRHEGRRLIRGHIQPALHKLRNFIIEEYLPKTRPSPGVWSLPRGLQYYRALLRWYLSVDLHPEHVHQVGLKEVARIKAHMIRIMKTLGFHGNLTSFFKILENKGQFYNHTEEDLVDEYRKIIYERIPPRLPEFFANLTDIPPVKVEAMSSDGVSAVYSDGTFLTNTKRPSTRPTFTMMAIALHESNPGHHLQVSLTQKLSIPMFRRYLWGGRKYSAPLHFPYYTAMVEGWGLYAEHMGEEMGLYEDPYEYFGRYTFEMFRACRLVVDTGIHAKRWSREEAVDYMLKHTFIARAQIEIEVDRYITWPGQACAYKIGEMKIKELRRGAEQRLGAELDLREFHWEVLRQGFVPLHMLEDSIHDWLRRHQGASGATSGVTSGAVRADIIKGPTVIPRLLFITYTTWWIILTLS